MTSQKPISVILLFGGIATLVMLGILFAAYKGGLDTFLNQTFFLINLIPLVCGVAAAFIQKKREGGYLEFREALKIIFGILVIGLALEGLFLWVLLHVIDPHFGQALGPASLVKAEATYRRFGVPEDEIRRSIDEQKGTDPFSVKSLILGTAIYYVMGFVVSAGLAFTIKRKKPADQPASTL
jgi:putative flippase GtrA